MTCGFSGVGGEARALVRDAETAPVVRRPASPGAPGLEVDGVAALLALSRLAGSVARLHTFVGRGRCSFPGRSSRSRSSGLVVPLGAWVLREACAQAAVFHGQLAAWMADRPPPAVQVGQVPAPAPLRSPRLLNEGADEHRILALHGEGASLHTIAAALNAAGRRTPNGPRWTTRTVARVVAARAAPARSASEGVGPAAAATRRTPVDLDSALGGDLRAVVELASLAPSAAAASPNGFASPPTAPASQPPC